jgi:hypothetical protein
LVQAQADPSLVKVGIYITFLNPQFRIQDIDCLLKKLCLAIELLLKIGGCGIILHKRLDIRQKSLNLCFAEDPWTIGNNGILEC